MKTEFLSETLLMKSLAVLIILIFISCKQENSLKGTYLLDSNQKDTLWILDDKKYRRSLYFNDSVKYFTGNWYVMKRRHIEFTEWFENNSSTNVYFNHNYNLINCSEIYTEHSRRKTYKKL
jgi:hypothetical protein